MGKSNSTVVMGIDPGSSLTGVAVVRMYPQRGDLIDAFAVKCKSGLKLPEKLVFLHDGVVEAVKKYKPELVGIESVFFFKNQKTVMEVSSGRGVIVLGIREVLPKVPIVDVSPPQVKMAVCGYGKAEKGQVCTMVKRLFGLKDDLKPDDVADAAAVAWSAYQLRHSGL